MGYALAQKVVKFPTIQLSLLTKKKNDKSYNFRKRVTLSGTK